MREVLSFLSFLMDIILTAHSNIVSLYEPHTIRNLDPVAIDL